MDLDQAEYRIEELLHFETENKELNEEFVDLN